LDAEGVGDVGAMGYACSVGVADDFRGGSSRAGLRREMRLKRRLRRVEDTSESGQMSEEAEDQRDWHGIWRVAGSWGGAWHWKPYMSWTSWSEAIWRRGTESGVGVCTAHMLYGVSNAESVGLAGPEEKVGKGIESAREPEREWGWGMLQVREVATRLRGAGAGAGAGARIDRMGVTDGMGMSVLSGCGVAERVLLIEGKRSEGW
jgi:hypothetical protein